MYNVDRFMFHNGKMRQPLKSHHSDEKDCIYVTQTFSGIMQNNCDIENALREKYKDILGKRELVICLQKSSEKAKWNCRSNKRKSICKMDINNSAKDLLPVKQLKKYDPLLYNAKVVLTRLPKSVIEEATANETKHSKEKLNNDVVTSKPNNNLRKDVYDYTLSKRKSSASNKKCINDLKPNLTKTENEESKKTKESKDARSNIISNNIKNNDKSNTLDIVNKYKLQLNISKRKLQDNQHNSSKKQKLINDENDKCIDESISQGTTDQIAEVKEDSSHKNVSENNSNINSVENVETDISENKISNITSNNLLRENSNCNNETKDPVKNVDCVVENTSNMHHNISENCPQPSLPDSVTIKSSKSISAITMKNITSALNNINNCPKMNESKEIKTNKINEITSKGVQCPQKNTKTKKSDEKNITSVLNNINNCPKMNESKEIKTNKIGEITSKEVQCPQKNTKTKKSDGKNITSALSNINNCPKMNKSEEIKTNKIDEITSKEVQCPQKNTKTKKSDGKNITSALSNINNCPKMNESKEIKTNKINEITSKGVQCPQKNTKTKKSDGKNITSALSNINNCPKMNKSEEIKTNKIDEITSKGVQCPQKITKTKKSDGKNITSALNNINNCPKMNESKEIKTNKIGEITSKEVQCPQKNTKTKKSDRNKLPKHFSIPLKSSVSVETHNDTSNVAETNANGMLSQLTIPAINKLKDLAPNENNENVTKKILNNEKHISVEQKKVETFGKVNNQECDLLQETWDSEKTTETFKTPIQNKYSSLDKLNSSKSTRSDEDEDDDCISLFADPALIDEYNTGFTHLKQNLSCDSTHTEKKQIMSNVADNKKTTNKNNKLHIDGAFWKERSEKTLEKNKKNVESSQNIIKNKSLLPHSPPTKEFINPLVTSRKDDSSYKSSHIKKSYSMTKSVIDKFYEKTIDEFNTLYDTDDTKNSKNTLNKNKCSSIAKPRKLATKLTTDWQNDYLFRNIFIGFCYQVIQFGKCSRQRCPFDHDHFSRVLTLYEKGEYYFFQVINELVSKGYHTFLLNIYEKLINHSKDVIFILKVCKKLYERNILNYIMGSRTIVLLMTKVPITTIIDHLTTIVNNSDSKFINWILDRIEVHIKYDTDTGYWNTIKPLLLMTENINSKIINSILYECITTGRHIKDVHENFISKLDKDIYPKINKDFLVRFNNKLSELRNPENIREMKEVKNTALNQPVVNIQSPESSNELVDASIVNDTFTMITQKVWDNNNNSIQNEKSSFVLHPIDDLPKPYSVHGRNINWKFYVDVYSLQEGLKHNNYKHVMKILNKIKQKEKTFYTRACYRILKNEIHYSQYRLSKLNSNTVRIGATAICYEILFDVTTHILADLAEKEFWVLALRLLKDIHIMLQMHIRLNELDATTILLFAEIYLANRQPVKVFTLLKESNIIFTCRNKWKVRSNETDDYARAQIMTLLLNTFCDTSSKYAFFLFEFLMSDQSSNYFPIDLTRAAKKLILIFLRERDYKMIINIVKLIYDYNLVLPKITYRAVIAALVHIDLTLAKQFYQIAVDLGIYSKLKFYPATHVIIKSNWTSEEMYLTIFNLMKQLSLNIGHAIDHMKPNKLSVYLVFEHIPSKKQHVFDEEIQQQCDNDINESKKIMKSVLQKFDPPISMIMTKKGKLQKLSSAKLFKHLQQLE